MFRLANEEFVLLEADFAQSLGGAQGIHSAAPGFRSPPICKSMAARGSADYEDASFNESTVQLDHRLLKDFWAFIKEKRILTPSRLATYSDMTIETMVRLALETSNWKTAPRERSCSFHGLKN